MQNRTRRNPGITSAIARINKAGALLVFPIKEKPELPSLWSAFYPGEKMEWDWSESGDERVAWLWQLRARLSDCNQVVYSKWFKNRATFFSLELFTALLSLVSPRKTETLPLSYEAKNILTVLNDDSPLGTKELKRLGELAGRENAARFERAMKELWLLFLIVGCGEVEESGYPSLAVGSSRLLFEGAWRSSLALTDHDRRATIARFFPQQGELLAQYLKVEKTILGDSSPGPQEPAAQRFSN